MKVLVIDNGLMPHRYGAKSMGSSWMKLLGPGARMDVRRAPPRDLTDASGYDRVVLTGSAQSCMETPEWVQDLDRWILGVIEQRVPLLGVCYGHQSIVRALDQQRGRPPNLRKAAAPELGWTQLRLLTQSPLTANLPKEFISYSQHFEEVSELPEGFRKLIESDRCAIQAFDRPGSPVFGVQFHPEYTAEDALKFFELHRSRGNGHLLLEPDRTEKLYNPEVAEIIFGNFLKGGFL